MFTGTGWHGEDVELVPGQWEQWGRGERRPSRALLHDLGERIVSSDTGFMYARDRTCYDVK
jgi:hypothetical protein